MPSRSAADYDRASDPAPSRQIHVTLDALVVSDTDGAPAYRGVVRWATRHDARRALLPYVDTPLRRVDTTGTGPWLDPSSGQRWHAAHAAARAVAIDDARAVAESHYEWVIDEA